MKAEDLSIKTEESVGQDLMGRHWLLAGRDKEKCNRYPNPGRMSCSVRGAFCLPLLAPWLKLLMRSTWHPKQFLGILLINGYYKYNQWIQHCGMETNSCTYLYYVYAHYIQSVCIHLNRIMCGLRVHFPSLRALLHPMPRAIRVANGSASES